MTADERLAQIRVKVERAKKHLYDLEVARDRFIETKPYTIQSKRDPQTGYDLFSVTDLKTPPTEIGLIAGDLIHNLRSALDHLAYQLVLTNGATPNRQTCFPIWDNAARYKTGRTRQVQGMAQSAIDAIDATEPYQDGNDALWCLHKLDIADKHHALLVTIVSVARMKLEVPGSFAQPSFRFPGFSLPNFQKPLKDGDVFFTCEPGMDERAEFTFDVALDEPEIIKGKPLPSVLTQITDRVDNIIITFKPLLA